MRSVQIAIRKRLLVDEHRELEGHEPAVDLLVADAVVVVVGPARLVEQGLGLVEVLLVGLELLRGPPSTSPGGKLPAHGS